MSKIGTDVTRQARKRGRPLLYDPTLRNQRKLWRRYKRKQIKKGLNVLSFEEWLSGKARRDYGKPVWVRTNKPVTIPLSTRNRRILKTIDEPDPGLSITSDRISQELKIPKPVIEKELQYLKRAGFVTEG